MENCGGFSYTTRNPLDAIYHTHDGSYTALVDIYHHIYPSHVSMVYHVTMDRVHGIYNWE